jgi:hypothetical protein
MIKISSIKRKKNIRKFCFLKKTENYNFSIITGKKKRKIYNYVIST